MAHPEQGLVILDRLAQDLEEIATVENKPKLEGRNMHMMFGPLRKKGGSKKAKNNNATNQVAKDDKEDVESE